MKAGRLSVVPTTAPPTVVATCATPETIEQGLAGSRRDVLAAMRLLMARRLDDGRVAGNALAAVSKELRELDRLVRLEDPSDENDVPPTASTPFDPTVV